MELQSRFSSLALSSMGMYPGAKVTRGKDWNYGDQDGKFEKKFNSLCWKIKLQYIHMFYTKCIPAYRRRGDIGNGSRHSKF